MRSWNRNFLNSFLNSDSKVSLFRNIKNGAPPWKILLSHFYCMCIISIYLVWEGECCWGRWSSRAIQQSAQSGRGCSCWSSKVCVCVSQLILWIIQSEFIYKLPLWEINMYFQLLDMLQPFFSISNVQAFSATRLSRQLHLSCSIRSVLASTLVNI